MLGVEAVGWERVPFDLTVTPPLLEDEVIDDEPELFLSFNDFSIASLSAGVISSEALLWERPAAFILSNKASSLIFKVLAKSFTVSANAITSFLIKPAFSSFHYNICCFLFSDLNNILKFVYS